MHGEILKMYVLSKELSFSNRAISNCMNSVTLQCTSRNLSLPHSRLILLR